MESPLPGREDPHGRKLSFNSPHAASWEKNLEFKEYQHHRNMLFCDSLPSREHNFRSRGHGNWRDGPARHRDGLGDLPSVTKETLKAVSRDAETRTIDIVGIPREIRTYVEGPVILQDWNDPHILTFGEGPCNIVFDEGKFMLPMRIGNDYRKFTIAGESHRIKLGVPTQELMLDGRGFKCFFGGKPITVHLAGQPRTVSLDGKPPNVNIDHVRNTAFFAGKIQLVINATKVVLLLDAKPQLFNIDGKSFVIQFVDALSAVTINNVRFPVEFRGLPIRMSVHGYRRFQHSISLSQVVIRGKEPKDKKVASLPDSQAQNKIVESAMKPNSSLLSLEMAWKPPMGNPADKTSSKGVTHPSLGMSSTHKRIFVPQEGPSPDGSASQVLPPPKRPRQTPPQVPVPHGPVALMFQAPPAVPAQSGVMQVTSMVSQMSQPKGLAVPLSLANMSHPPPNVIPGLYMTSQLPPNLITPSQLPTVPLDLNALLENLTRTGLINAKAHGTFSQFFHQETEEWRSHNSIQGVGVNFFPACHQDMLKVEAAEQEKENGEKGKERNGAEKNKEYKEESDKEAENGAEEGTEEVPMGTQGSVTEKLKEPMEVKEIDLHGGNSSSKEEMVEPTFVPFNAAETDIASSIDGNTELSNSDTKLPNTNLTKIKFNMSKKNLSINNNNINNAENRSEKKKLDHRLLNFSSIEEDVEEFVPPPFTVDYDLKPSFIGVKLIEQPFVGRSVELSGMCSIM